MDDDTYDPEDELYDLILSKDEVSINDVALVVTQFTEKVLRGAYEKILNHEFDEHLYDESFGVGQRYSAELINPDRIDTIRTDG